jgi:hypothetical protein
VTLGAEGLLRIDGGALSAFGGLRAGALFIERATEGHAISHWGVGMDIGLNVDVVSLGEAGACFLRLTLDAFLVPHAVFVPRSLLWGPSVALGFRL